MKPAAAFIFSETSKFFSAICFGVQIPSFIQSSL